MSWWTTDWPWTSSMPLWPRSPMVSWGALKECDQQVNRADPSPLLCPGEATTGVLCHSRLHSSKRQGTSRERPAESHKDDWGHGTPPIWRKTKRPGTLHSGEEKTEGGISSVYKYLKCGSKVDGARLLSVACSNRTRGNRQKLEHKKFHTNMRKNFSTERTTEHWHSASSLPREDVESLSLEIFKMHLHACLCNFL